MFCTYLFPLLILFTLYQSIHADRFSQIAEAHNVLDYQQLGWTNKPFLVDLKLFGYVKAEGIFDSRQNFALRDGHLLYFPLEKRPDILGADINSRGTFDAYAIQTRIDLSGEGPDIGCYTSGFLIEGDFFGRTELTINEYELRLGFLELRSECLTFLAGQNYHPICFPFESPDTISFNSGIPIAPYALCPQFKVTYTDRHIEFLAAAIGYIGDRPFGVAGADDKVFRDAMMPDFFVQMRVMSDVDNYTGVGFDVMRIVPRLQTNFNFKEVSPITSVATDFFIRLQYNDFVLYSKLIYAQNAAIFELIGGIAVKTRDPLTDIRTYAPLQTLGCYVEFIRQGTFEPGLFIGYVKNLGAGTTIIPSLENQVSVFGIGTNISNVFRISPRIRWYLNSFIVGIEYEYTRAAYGILNNRAQVENAIPVANNRFLFATYYVF